ncbi:MAG: hypothetical protein HKN85_13220 [Gammaproteobacteria bacterium]|nr:hypothetical protein [Gammaproteobacteria bacterium]
MNKKQSKRIKDGSAIMGSARPDRRKLLMLVGIGGVAAGTLPGNWSRPIINAVILPAHAQTSCVADAQVGGPLTGHPSGSATCQAACQSEADALGAQLCEVTETVVGGATQCACDIDLP